MFGDAGDGEGVAAFLVPAGTKLQRHWHRHRLHHRFQNATDQHLVAQQGRAGVGVAHLLGRAAHVDVDDLRAMVDIEARRIAHHLRISAGNLHRDRIDFAFMIGATAGFLATPEQRVRGHHFRHRHAGAQALAQLAKWPIRHASHGCDEQVVAKNVIADLHKNRYKSITYSYFRVSGEGLRSGSAVLAAKR